jgi:hypothetical protein
MRKASFIFALAAGLLASFAMTGSSQAGSILTIVPSDNGQIDDYGVTSGTVSKVVFTFDIAPTAVSAFSGSPTPIASYFTIDDTADTVTYTPPVGTTGGSLMFSVSFAGPSTASDFIGAQTFHSPGGAGSEANFTATAVPEPTSMALFGIGLASFFTYRRYFKKATV